MSDEDYLHEPPGDFIKEHFLNDGYCDAQAIYPVDGGVHCHCTCGSWDIVVATTDEGLALAAEHTMPVTERELAKRAKWAAEDAKLGV